MIVYFLFPLYIIFSIYFIKRVLFFFNKVNDIFNNKIIKVILISIITFFSSSILLGFLLPKSDIKMFFRFIGNYWLGVLIYISFALFLTHTISFIVRRCKFYNDIKNKKRIYLITRFVLLIIITVVSVYGFINSRYITVKNYNIDINKKCDMDKMKITLIADLHIGDNIGVNHITRMVDKINKENPDIVLIAGDIFNNSYDEIKDPDKIIELLRSIKTKYGVYAVYGNHDIDEAIFMGFTFNSKSLKSSDKRMDDFLRKSNIKLLKDEYVLINDQIYVFGRPDINRPGVEYRKSVKEIVSEIDINKPVILLEHQPLKIKELSLNGFDLALYGHTHNGQLSPFSYLEYLKFDNVYGLKYIYGMPSIVTSGVGVYGPNMRVGNKAEIVNIYLTFKGD